MPGLCFFVNIIPQANKAPVLRITQFLRACLGAYPYSPLFQPKPWSFSFPAIIFLLANNEIRKASAFLPHSEGPFAGRTTAPVGAVIQHNPKYICTACAPRPYAASGIFEEGNARKRRSRSHCLRREKEALCKKTTMRPVKSAYLRRLILDKPVRPGAKPSITLCEINRIGTNINQIARLHAGMTDPGSAAAQALFLLQRCTRSWTARRQDNGGY